MTMRRAGAAALTLAVLAGCGQAPANTATAAGPAGASAEAATPVAVPFVGCAQDGQTGPQPAPTGPAKVVTLPPAVAAQLAFYSADGQRGVLAPRGWQCFGAYGSNGASLYVAPTPIRSSDVLSTPWALSGPAIQLSVSDGDTSGRFEVAQAIMRLFPSQQSFAQKVIAEGIEPASDFPSGPFPGDAMKPISGTLVEYQTPANTPQGLGVADSRLTANADPIEGAAALEGDTPNLAFLAVRLAPEQQALAPIIVQQFEADSAVVSKAIIAQDAAPPTPAPASAGGSAASVVRAFYADLGQGDGTSASNLVIPAKRASGPFSATALTAYYGAMRQPLTLGAATQTGPGAVNVSYAFVDAHGHACNGRAVVSVTSDGGQWLISGIHALDGC